jgi:hypothetical protein
MPTVQFHACSTTVVGVAVFSETRNRRVNTLNVQMSRPLAIASTTTTTT